VSRYIYPPLILALQLWGVLSLIALTAAAIIAGNRGWAINFVTTLGVGLAGMLLPLLAPLRRRITSAANTFIVVDGLRVPVEAQVVEGRLAQVLAESLETELPSIGGVRLHGPVKGVVIDRHRLRSEEVDGEWLVGARPYGPDLVAQPAGR
jgi:hypothetical protein